MFPFRRILALTFISTLGLSSAAEPPPTGEIEPLAENPYRQSILRLDPMDSTGLDYGLSNVLRNYYKQNFASAEHWDALQSIRFEGVLYLPQGAIRFTAFKKKPDYCKVVLFAPGGGRIVMAYDGEDAWQFHALRSSESEVGNTSAPASRIPHPVSLPPAEARNFIRDATAGGHLFFPLIEGKQIELVGTAEVDGERCYEIRVTLPDGQIIRSFLDMTDYRERRQITINNVSGDEEVTTHSDFRMIDEIRVPFVSTLTIDGEQIHQSRLYDVQTDLGVMPWMFSRPSGAYIPGAKPPAATMEGNAPSLPSVRPFSGSLTRESGLRLNPNILPTNEIEAILREAGIPPAPETAP